MAPDVIVRASIGSDIAAITEIYRYHVIEGTGSFELVPPDEKEIAKRRDDVVRRRLPWLVAEVEGKVIAYAYASPFRAREAYRFTVEDSIYVSPEWSRQGIGRLLLERVIAMCRDDGYTQMLALIGDSKNVGSIRLHERCGFEHAGVLKDVGIKFDRPLDVVLMQLKL